MKKRHDSQPDLFGIDGCKAGWFVVRQCGRTGELSASVVNRFADVLDWNDAHAIVAVDMPVGLASNGMRACDTQARKLLGRPRASSVFSPPIRAALAASSYEEACAINHAVSGKRISIQAFHIRDKIAEVDNVMRKHANASTRIVEVHPELSFMHVRMEQGGPAHGLRESKAQAPGFALRHALLVRCFGSVIDSALSARKPAQTSRDDILDAFAVLWTARRIASGQAFRIPEALETDAEGIPMSIYC
jgi:predicted RNase H-like nuclease